MATTPDRNQARIARSIARSRIPDHRFIAAVLLSAADRSGTKMVREWHANALGAERAILRERKLLADPNNVAECTTRILGLIGDWNY